MSTYFFGNVMMIDTLLRVDRRSFAALSMPTYQALTTVRSMMKASTAIAAPAMVSEVRSALRRGFLAAMESRFMVSSPSLALPVTRAGGPCRASG